MCAWPSVIMRLPGNLTKLLKQRAKKGLIHLAADTGMTRIGFKDSEESLEEIRRIAALPNVEIEGLFTHFARADEYDRTPAMVQHETIS